MIDFPIPIDELAGRRLLVIAIPTSDVNLAGFYKGVAQSGDGRICLAEEKSGAIRVFELGDVPLRGFDPTHAMNFIAADRDSIRGLLVDVEACVTLFVDALPPGGVRVTNAFYGLARSAVGEALLMEGAEDEF